MVLDSMDTKDDKEDFIDVSSLPKAKTPLDIDLNISANCGFDLN